MMAQRAVAALATVVGRALSGKGVALRTNRHARHE